jgi:hypothetical protein
MNLTTPQPEGSTSIGDTHLELIAACLPGNAVTAHWACGLPLSFVQEMAGLWLAQHDQTAKAHTSSELASSFVDPNTGTK